MEPIPLQVFLLGSLFASKIFSKYGSPRFPQKQLVEMKFTQEYSHWEPYFLTVISWGTYIVRISTGSFFS
jgi:hypothetical protein